MKTHRPLARFGVLVAVLCLAVAGGLRADTVSALVKSVQGSVEFARPGSSAFAALTPGQQLPVGSTIRTGSDGNADIVTTPGSAIHLGPDSHLRLNALAFAKSGSTVTQREAHLQLDSGVVSALIDPSTPKVTDFEVKTPEGSAAARGTFYAVSVIHGKTYVDVARGKVGAIAGSKHSL